MTIAPPREARPGDALSRRIRASALAEEPTE